MYKESTKQSAIQLTFFGCERMRRNESLKNSEITQPRGDIMRELIMNIRDVMSDCEIDAENTVNAPRMNETVMPEIIPEAEIPSEDDTNSTDSKGSDICMELPLDWENVFDSDPRAEDVHADSISDGLILSLTNLAKVDIEYIASVTGEEYKTVINALKGSIYQNPETWDECFYKGWETAEEYLSGNLMRKLKAAREADLKYNGLFADNIAAIKAVMPVSATAEDIYITLGSPWIPTDIIDEFIDCVLGDRRYRTYYSHDALAVKHDEQTGTWEIPHKNRYRYSVKVTNTYGTSRLNALHILERTLNMRSVTVTDEVDCPTAKSGKKRVVNHTETLLAIEKQQKIIDAFKDWVWSDPDRKKRLEEIFENRFGCMRQRIFDGSFLKFPTMSPSVSLYPYQKNAVARILFTPNTLLAHDVGSGKTYIMAAAGMELRRMGLSAKNMYVVPNNIVGQWEHTFHTIYPDAKLLCVEPKNFTPAKRQKVLERIRDEDFDGVIIAYSCFEQVPLSKDYYIEKLSEECDRLSEIINTKGITSAKMKKKLNDTKEKLYKLTFPLEAADTVNDTDDSEKEAVYDGICFDELGVTRLFVDEAHNFKNVPVDTKTDRVLGINAAGSQKCREMLDKVREVQKRNNGGGVVLATGTPITNSLTDAYVMQQYLQSGELSMLDLGSFDSWIGMFAEKKTEFEIDVDTNSYRLATRFSKFHNLTELTSLLASVADFHRVDATSGIPETNGYDDALVPKTAGLSEYLDSISERADDVRKGNVSRKEDNMLKITTDGRKAALDLRLVDKTAGFTYLSKAARCAENVLAVYNMTACDKGVQLVFCDSSTPKADFNLYDEVKRLLISFGIPEHEIAFIHDASTAGQRSSLFAKARSGDIRVLIGSTFKLGLGVNIQKRLAALHHLDVPWRPADMTQREGRILRQGNMYSKVRIFRYITEGSFDAYSWQLLETKQRFISELLSGSLTQRDGTDIDDTVLNYAEVKALAVGDPLIKQRVETANELSKLLTLKHRAVETRLNLEKELAELPAKMERQRELIRRCESDRAHYSEWTRNNPPPADTNGKRLEAESRKNMRETVYEAVSKYVLKPNEEKLMSYRGFDIVLPANMTRENPFIRLVREGSYIIGLGGSDVGALIRIDNFLDNLDRHFELLCDTLSKLTVKESQINAELSAGDSFTEDIERCRHKLEKIDEKLGVNKQ